MSRYHPHDWAHRKIRANPSLLLLLSTPKQVLALLIRKGQISEIVQSQGANPIAAAQKAFEQLQTSQATLPRYCCVLTSEARLAPVPIKLPEGSDEATATRAVQFAMSSQLEEIFAPTSPVAQVWCNDVLSSVQKTQLEKSHVTPEEEDLFLESIKSYGLTSENNSSTFAASPGATLTPNDVRFTSQSLGADSALASAMVKARINAWQSWCKEHKLSLTACLPLEAAHLSPFLDHPVVAYLDHRVASLSRHENGEAFHYEEFHRDSTTLPSTWIHQLEILADENSEQQTPLILSETDLAAFEREHPELLTKFNPVSRYSKNHLSEIAHQVVIAFGQNRTGRRLLMHSPYEILPPASQRLSFWQGCAFAFGALCAGAIFLPPYFKKQDLTKESERLVEREKSLRLEIAELGNNKKELQQIRQELATVQNTNRNVGRGSTLKFPHAKDHLNFLDTLASNLGETPGVQIDSYGTDWQGRITLVGGASSMAEARSFTDSFVRFLDNDLIPKHRIEIELEEDTGLFQVKILPES